MEKGENSFVESPTGGGGIEMPEVFNGEKREGKRIRVYTIVTPGMKEN